MKAILTMRLRPQASTWILAGLCLAMTSAPAALANKRPIEPPSSNGRMVFSLLPRSFSKNAWVDMTVFGEVTEAGRQKPAPGINSPIYYVAQSGGYRVDPRAPLGERIPSETKVTDYVTRGLTRAGFLSAEKGQTPDIIIIYSWGSQYSLPLSVRSVLVGGTAFAREIDDVYKRQNVYFRGAERMVAIATPRPLDLRSADSFASNENANLGAATKAALPFFSFESFQPLKAYELANKNNATLLEHLRNDFYYVVISAYDYAPRLTGQQVLLWRTHLTVDATGVSFEDTLPALLTASPTYLGKDTGRPGTLTQKMLRSGTVELGPTEIIEENVPDTRDSSQKSRRR